MVEGGEEGLGGGGGGEREKKDKGCAQSDRNATRMGGGVSIIRESGETGESAATEGAAREKPVTRKQEKRPVGCPDGLYPDGGSTG